jgi:hypothetical protein
MAETQKAEYRMNKSESAERSDLYTQEELRERIARFVENRPMPRRLNVFTDTSDFFRIDYDNVVILKERPYLIRNYEREGRFGIDEQPKYWVRRAIDLEDGSMKIIKMVFLENFKARVGDITFDCVRSPRKEARILDLTRGHPNFMQGFGTRDDKGNIIRIIDYIRGTTLDSVVEKLGKSHEEYYYDHFPSFMDDYIELVKAIKFLHDHGEKHGDIRRDHIIKDKHSGHYAWIDFDYNYWHKENMFGYDMFSLGNILIYLLGRRDFTLQYLAEKEHPAMEQLSNDDMNIFFNNRVANLKKIFPYVENTLNVMLLHFSAGANVFYDNTSQFLDDLSEVRNNLGKS